MLKKLFHILLFSLVLFTQQLVASDDFNFEDLACKRGDPRDYTVACFNSKLIPTSLKVAELKKHKDFNPVRNWIKRDLINRVEDEDDDKIKLSINKSQINKNPYYVVTLYNKVLDISPAERLTTRLTNNHEKEIEEDEYAYGASMIIFSQSQTSHALVYLLGKWKQLYNRLAIMHDWGLRLAASNELFIDQIKQISGKNNFAANPTTRGLKKQRLASIDTFSLEVGTEGLQSLRMLPSYAKGTKCQRLITGSDCFKFCLPEAEGKKKGNTLEALYAMGNYLFGIYNDNTEIHPKLLAYIDEQVSETAKIKQLNQLLIATITSDDATYTVFPADIIWQFYGRAALFSYGTKKDANNLLETLKEQKVNLDSPISIKKRGQKKDSAQEPLGRIIYSLPIADEDGEFYRFDRGYWFKVSASRFGAIIRKMRSPEIKVEFDDLLPYQIEDSRGGVDEEKGLYHEARYNRRVIASLKGKKLKGILLDRVNLYFAGRGNQIEFADMLLFDGKGKFSIVHVKRQSKDIDHHRTQVERCAEYLATELDKENSHDLLLQGHINGLYIKHKVSLSKVKNKGKRLTHANYFEEAFNAKRAKKETWEDYLNEKILNIEKGEKAQAIGQLKTTLQDVDLSEFENYEGELASAFDALYDCEMAEKEALPKKEVERFLEGVQQLIEMKSILFSSGILKKKIRDKITIVMAVVDDRRIANIYEAEKKLNSAKKASGKSKKATVQTAEKKLESIENKDRQREEALFKKQHLWGLDSTCEYVRKKDFRFNLTVINENTDRKHWDSFGSTKANIWEEGKATEDSSEESTTSDGSS